MTIKLISRMYVALLEGGATMPEVVRILRLKDSKIIGPTFAPGGFRFPVPYENPFSNWSCYGCSSLASMPFNRNRFIEILKNRGVAFPADIDDRSLEAWVYNLPPEYSREEEAAIARKSIEGIRKILMNL